MSSQAGEFGQNSLTSLVPLFLLRGLEAFWGRQAGQRVELGKKLSTLLGNEEGF